MIDEQLFVGGVAALLGLLAFWASFLNQDWCYQLPKIRWIVDRWGRTTARAAYAIVGAMLITLGTYVSFWMHRNG